MSQLVAGVSISGSFVDYSTLYEYFRIRVGVFFFFFFLIPQIISYLYDIADITYNYNCCVEYAIWNEMPLIDTPVTNWDIHRIVF